MGMSSVQSFSGERLRQARHRKGWTQAQLAHNANVRERQVVRWENDQHSPRFDSIVALANALGCDVDTLCAETGDNDDEEADPMADLSRALQALVRHAVKEQTAA